MRCNAYSWCLSWKQAKKFIFWLAAYQSRKSENELYCLLCLSLYLLSGFDQFPITSSYVWPGFQIDLGTFENTCDLWNGAQNNPWGKTATVGGSAAKSWMGCDPSLGSRDISRHRDGFPNTFLAKVFPLVLSQTRILSLLGRIKGFGILHYLKQKTCDKGRLPKKKRENVGILKKQGEIFTQSITCCK